MTPKLGIDFDSAVCAYFGLPADKVIDELKLHTDRNDIFSVSLTIALTADDLRGIAEVMGRKT